MKILPKLTNIAIIFIFILTTLFTIAATPLAESQTIYVDGSKGSDSNDGLTTETAFQTIQQAVNIVQPGSSIYVRGGTYYENIIVARSGAESASIKLTNYDNEEVTINGGGTMALRARGQVDYWVLEGLTFRSTDRYTLRLGWWGELTTNHWIVRNNKIFGANFLMGSYHIWENNNIDGTGYTQSLGDAGISDAGDSHHNIYRNNIVHDFTSYNARGIWTQGYTHDTVIENNYVYNIMARSGLGQCIDLDGAEKVEWRHVVRNNTVENCSYVGIQLENAFDTLVENNVVIEGGNAGIIVINYDERVGCKTGGEDDQYGDTNGDNNCRGDDNNVTIRQNVISTNTGWSAGYGGIMVWYAGGVDILSNTIYSTYGTANAGINYQGTAQEIQGGRIINNVITQGTGYAFCARELSGIEAISDNLVYRANGREPFASGQSCNIPYTTQALQSAAGLGQNTIVSDPEFTDVNNFNFSLLASSPAIDTGVNTGSNTDITGNIRPSGDGYDMGAYEFEGEAIVQPTNTPTEEPTEEPTVEPTEELTEVPTLVPTEEPIQIPTEEPTAVPTTEPTKTPAEEPTVKPTTVPTEEPTQIPTNEPTEIPAEEPQITDPINVALGKAASQSSTYGYADASLAVDGNIDSNYYNGSVSHTQTNTNAWWEVDLGASYDISTLRLWNRKDGGVWRLENFYIFISDTPFESTNLSETFNQHGVTSFFSEDRAGSPSEYVINTTGRYVRIQLKYRDKLHMAEVEVMGMPAK